MKNNQQWSISVAMALRIKHTVCDSEYNYDTFIESLSKIIKYNSNSW